MKTKVLDFLSFIIALVATVLAYADTQAPLQAISPTLADKWPVIMGGALLISRIARMIGDYLDDGKFNDSFGKEMPKVLLISGTVLIASLFTGCVNGRPAPWLTAQVCYSLPNGIRSCAGVNGGNMNISLEGFSK